MKIKFAIKNTFADKYLAVADDSDRIRIPNRAYAFHDCNAIYEIALFDTKEDAIKAYEQSNSMPYNETGMIVELIVSDDLC